MYAAACMYTALFTMNLLKAHLIFIAVASMAIKSKRNDSPLAKK